LQIWERQRPRKSRSAKPLILHLTRLGSVSHACASQSCNAAYATIRTFPGAWGCQFQTPHSIQQVHGRQCRPLKFAPKVTLESGESLGLPASRLSRDARSWSAQQLRNGIITERADCRVKCASNGHP
jgi:hypothetical protein